MEMNEVIPVSPISAPTTIPPTPVKEKTASSDANLKFQDVFIQNFEIVRNRLTKSEELFKYFISLVEVRVDQERACLKCGETVINRACLSEMLLSSDSCVASSVDSFRINILKRSHLARQFVDDVTSEVIDPCKQTVLEQKSFFASLESDGSNLSKQLQKEHKAHDEALINFDTSLRYAYSKVTAFQPSMSPLDHIKTGLLCHASAHAEERYHEAVFRVNKVRSQYLEKMGVILNQLEELEKTRLEIIKDGLEKMFVFELALNRGIQYELESSFKEIEKFHTDISNEISNFISRNKPIRPSALKNGPVQIVSLGEITEENPPLAQTPAEVQSMEKKVLDSIWERNTTFILSNDELEAVKEAFASQVARLSFCRAVAGQSSEIHSLQSLQQLGRVLNIALSWCESEMDSETGRRVASFALKFFTYCDQRKKFLQSEIYHHSLWNRIQFWEEALALTVSDYLVCEFTKRLDSHLSFIFASGIPVDRFGSYLMVFGLNVNSAIDIVKRVMMRDFAALSSKTRSELTEKLLESVKSAHEKQERNIASLSNFPSPKISP